jgi:hypothetical protein
MKNKPDKAKATKMKNLFDSTLLILAKVVSSSNTFK